MSKCGAVRGLLTLRPGDRRAEESSLVEAHLAACPDCAALARAYAEQDRLLRSAPPVSLTPSQRGQLLARIPRERERYMMHTKLFSIFGTAAFVAALVAMALGLNLLFKQHLQTATPPTPDPTSALPPTWTTYSVADSPIQPWENVTAIAVASDGALWVGTGDLSIYRLDAEGWTDHSAVAADMGGGGVSSIVATPDGAVWIGTQEGLLRFAGETWTTYTAAGLAGDQVTSLAMAPDGTLWAGTSVVGVAFEGAGGGISRFDGSSWTTYPIDDGPTDAYSVLSIAAAPGGALWAVAQFYDSAGAIPAISRFDGSRWTTYGDLPGVEARLIAAAPDGALWGSATELVPSPAGGGGTQERSVVFRFDGQNWTIYTPEDGLPQAEIGAIAAAPDGTVWIGTNGAGIARFDGQRWTTYTAQDGLAGDAVEAITIAPDGALWIGAGSAIFRFMPPSPTPHPPIPEAVKIGDDIETVEARLLAEGYEVEDSRQVTLDGATYHAVLYLHPDRPRLPKPARVLIYKEKEGRKTLFYDLESDVKQLDFGGRYRDDFEYTMLYASFGGDTVEGKESGWYDMNGDGLPELGVFISDMSNGWIHSQIQVLQLHPGNDIVNLTRSVPPEDKLDLLAVSRLEDINDDGIMEWMVTDARFELAFGLCHACSPSAIRIYAWDGHTYRNASAQFPEYYQPIMDDLLTRLERFEFPPDDDAEDGANEYKLGTLISLLLTHENAGRRDEGWAIFEAYADPEQYGQIDEGSYRSGVALLEAWRYFNEEYGSVNPPLPVTGRFQWPTARHEISGWSFHDPRNPTHTGIDIAAEEGDPVSAADGGSVVFAGWNDQGYGNLVIVEHAAEWRSYYGQLAEIAADAGQEVQQGELLGRAGATGYSTGPHLHFELQYRGQPVDPICHLPSAPPPTPSPEISSGMDAVVCAAIYPGLPGCLRDESLVGGWLAFVDARDPFDNRPTVLDLEHGDVWLFGQGASALRGWSPSGEYLLTTQGVHRYDGELVSLDVLPSAFWAPPDALPDAYPGAHDWLAHAAAGGALEAVPFPLDEPPRQILPPGSLGSDGRATALWARGGPLAWTPALEQLQENGLNEQALYVQQVPFGGEEPTAWQLSDNAYETYYILLAWVPGTDLILAGQQFYMSASMLADGVPLFAIDTDTGEITDLDAWMPLTDEAYAWHPTQPGLLALVEGGGRFLTDPPKRLTLLDLTTGESRVLTGEDVAAFESAWSPDGTLLAYVAGPTASFDKDGGPWEQTLNGRAVYVVDPATGESRALTEPGDEAIDGWPQWSADGSRLLYTRQHDDATDVRVVALDGSGDDLLLTGLPDPMCFYNGCNWQQMLAYHPGP